MPGFDGTGPYGTGPAGWGRGPCRRSLGFGWRRTGWRSVPLNEKEALEEEAKALEEELKAVKKRLGELK